MPPSIIEITPAEFSQPLELRPIAVTRVPARAASAVLAWLRARPGLETSGCGHLKRFTKDPKDPSALLVCLGAEDGRSYESVLTELSSVVHAAVTTPVDRKKKNKKDQKDQRADAAVASETAVAFGGPAGGVTEGMPTGGATADAPRPSEASEVQLRLIPKAIASRFAPYTKQQLEEFSKSWPALLQPSFWTPLSRAQLDCLALEAAARFAEISGKRGECGIFAEDGTLLACTTGSSSHPLKHAVMAAIDAASRAVKESEQRPTSAGEPAPPGAADGQYILTGASVFCEVEPCVMCAMALTHSRVARVVFRRKNAAFGGCGGKLSVHCERQLNHHFMAAHFCDG